MRLGLRVYEAVSEASRKDEVVKEYRLYDLLGKVKNVLEAGQAMRPPFHGTTEGFGTEEIKATSNA
eukprot:15313127-Heterocapsa_arctica.AAC.1